MTPRLGQDAKLRAHVEELIFKPIFSSRDIFSNQQPTLKLLSINQLELAVVAGLTLAATLQYCVKVRNLVDLPRDGRSQTLQECLVAFFDGLHGLEISCLYRVGASITRADEKILLNRVQICVRHTRNSAFDDFFDVREQSFCIFAAEPFVAHVLNIVARTQRSFSRFLGLNLRNQTSAAARMGRL